MINGRLIVVMGVACQPCVPKTRIIEKAQASPLVRSAVGLECSSHCSWWAPANPCGAYIVISQDTDLQATLQNHSGYQWNRADRSTARAQCQRKGSLP